MGSSEQVVETDTEPSMIEQLGKALKELEAYRNATEDRVQWIEIEEHFCNLDKELKKKFEELEERERDYEKKEAEIHKLIAEREAAVVTKEQDLLDRIQELKDAAVAAIAEVRANHRPACLESIGGRDNKDNKVSSSLGDTNSPQEYSPHNLDENANVVAADVKPRAELTQFCKQMDSIGLLGFIMENQKNPHAIRKELSVALESATEPARLVLDILQRFCPPLETTQPMDKNVAALKGMRKSCFICMEAMAAFMARNDPGANHLLNPEIKQQAKAIADEWKPKLASADIDATNGNSLEADAFLQLLSTFRIASEFDEEELCKLVLVVAHRRQAPELCQSLGLAHKMPGVVMSLIHSGKQIDAVNFIHAFELTDSFPPVPLLKTYLKDVRRNSQEKGGNSGGTEGSQGYGNAQELAALKAVIRCVQEYKLESEYPLDTLKKRVSQLEKSKSDKKRVGDFGRHKQQKKHRANGGYRGFQGSQATGGVGGRQGPLPFIERTAYTGMPERTYSHAGPYPYEYQYQVPSQSSYGHQAADQRMYYHPQDDRINPSPYDAPPSSYVSYMGSGMGSSSHQPYM